MATQRYFGSDYFGANYFDAEYFAAQSGGSIIGSISATVDLAGPGLESGRYWSENYWGSGHWSSTYWKLANSDGGTTFYGTFEAPDQRLGTLSTTLDSHSAVFTGSLAQVDLFDIELGFTVRWESLATSTYTGSIGVTLDDVTSDIMGLFTADVLGSIGTTLDGFTAAISGTNANPASTSGVISTTLDDALTNFDGLSIASGTLGQISASLPEFTADFQAQYITSDTGGVISASLDDVTADWEGAIFEAGDRVGALNAAIDVSSAFAGTHRPLVPRPRRRRNVRITRR